MTEAYDQAYEDDYQEWLESEYEAWVQEQRERDEAYRLHQEELFYAQDPYRDIDYDGYNDEED